ncbi:MAG: carbohydrate ABC transporter permease [Alicyclobacillus herbarius]|uniref:carbohydrate ABC transporter permease n=1 Tax=Alicyclobacillus herbarius TaxID=122960 RepID=UPI002355E636|nr:carbohydrate ABC transporter permease [Alicyclobacillus herbarius]MCL6633670.1 carbohydrate ABC transporter permease [Alicyclobacillus herbarius]
MSATHVQRRASVGTIFVYIFVFLALVWAVVPLLWMILSSLKTQAGMFSMPPKFFFKPTFYTYQVMFSSTGHFGGYLANSVIASVSSTIISLVLGTLGGWAIARGNFKREKDISFWIISTRMAPIPAVMLPLYLLFSKLGLIGTMSGLVFAYTTFNLPFALWIMMTFFKDIPAALEEAGMVDGCNKFQAFYRVTLPMAAPGLVATGILCLMFAWNDYAFASVFSGTNSQTVPVAASLLVSQQGVQWGQAMATGTIIMAPMVVAGLFVRKYLVRGLSMGAIK